MTKRRQTPEGSLKTAVRDLLNAEKIPWWPMQSGKVKSQFGGWMNLCPKGTADILAAVSVKEICEHIEELDDIGGRHRSGTYHVVPAYLWLELKATTKPKKEQLDFADMVRNRGHYHMFVTDVRQVAEWLREHRAR